MPDVIPAQAQAPGAEELDRRAVEAYAELVKNRPTSWRETWSAFAASAIITTVAAAVYWQLPRGWLIGVASAGTFMWALQVVRHQTRVEYEKRLALAKLDVDVREHRRTAR